MEANNIVVIKEAQKELDTLIASGNEKGEELIANLEASQIRAIIILSVLGCLSVTISISFAL